MGEFILEKDLNVFLKHHQYKTERQRSRGSIRNLQIEDLLNRKPIKIQNEKVKKQTF